MLARDTKIYKDSYMLTKEVFGVTKRIKTEFRSSIARRLEELSIEISMRIVEANLCAPDSDERLRVLGHDFIVSYERFFYLLSLAFDLRLIDFKQHATLSRILDGIGKQATGWRKSTNKR